MLTKVELAYLAGVLQVYLGANFRSINVKQRAEAEALVKRLYKLAKEEVAVEVVA